MSHGLCLVCVALTGAIALAASAAAQDKSETLPQSGNFKTHAGFKVIGTVTKIADNHTMGNGTAWGVAYDDAGHGVLHMGTAMCPNFSEVIGSKLSEQGECTWSDRQGDKIFTRFSATGDVKSGAVTGDQTIHGGTGKFAGIEGTAPFKCQAVSAEGQFSCATDWKYEITATGSSEPKK